MTEDTKNTEVASPPEEKPGSPEQGLAAQENEFESVLLDEGTETGIAADDHEGNKMAAGADEDFGITLSDDELWDSEGGDDGIPLFDELALEIGEAETEHAAPQVSGEEEIAPEAAGGQGSVTANGLDIPAEAISAVTPEEEIAQAKDSPAATSWIPWGVTGMSSLMLVVGLFVLWSLTSTAGQMDPDRSGTSFQAGQQDGRTVPVRQSGGAGSGPVPGTFGGPETLRDMDRISLAPFLIPAQRGGEMVFLKLQVELTVADSTTKHGLLKKEAWVRDAIYRELKGIDISSGDAGNFLLQYRRPLIERLDRELAPLTIEDIRLAGFLMK
jgi:hypothetical protein